MRVNPEPNLTHATEWSPTSPSPLLSQMLLSPQEARTPGPAPPGNSLFRHAVKEAERNHRNLKDRRKHSLQPRGQRPAHTSSFTPALTLTQVDRLLQADYVCVRSTLGEFLS